MPNKYRVKAGNFRDKGRVYQKGDLVYSELDLAKMFPNKFKVISGPKATRTQELIDTNESLPGTPKRPRAATIGTDQEEESSKSEDGDDSEKLDAVRGEDSELDEETTREDDEEGGDEDDVVRRPKKKDKSGKKKKNR